jgi:exodeoxyribonuclease VII small subunit
MAKEDPKASPSAGGELPFEKGLETLETIVRELENGDLALERSIELFEQGMKLSADCRKQLENAEMRVEQLVRRGDTVTPEPFRP